MLDARNRRRALILADQGASSLSNVVVAVLVARAFPDETEQFAAFALAMLVFQFVVGCVRGFLYEPALSIYPDRPRVERMQIVPGYIGATLVVGAAAAAMVAAVAAAVGGIAGTALIALATVMPLVFVQDAWRYLFMIDKPGAALLADLTWLVSTCLLIAFLPARSEVAWYVIAWGIGGACGGLVATVVERASLGRLRWWSYVREHRELAWRFLSEYIAAQAGNYGALFVGGSVLGLAAYGALRAGTLYLGPLLTLQAAVILAALPEAVRLRARPDRLVRLVAGAVGAVAVPALAWTAVGVALPASLGEELFGPTWRETQGVLLPMGLAQVAAAAVAAALIGVRALDGTKGIGVQLRSAPLQLICPVAGAVFGDLQGFALGMVVGQTAAAILWWSTFRRLLARQRGGGMVNGLSPQAASVPGDTPVVSLDEI